MSDTRWTRRQVAWYALLGALLVASKVHDMAIQTRSRAAAMREAAEIKALVLWGQVR